MEKVYSATETTDYLREHLPQWCCEDNHIVREYRTHGWKGTLMVVNTIGHLAEAAWHHPELVVAYNRVSVRLQNHAAGGVTDKDFALAARLDDVVLWRPGNDSGALSGTPADPRYAYLKYPD